MYVCLGVSSTQEFKSTNRLLVASSTITEQLAVPTCIEDDWHRRICCVGGKRERFENFADKHYRIRKAVPLNASNPIIAVKFINKDHAFRAGRLRPKQLHLELSLHKQVCPHDNIIKYLAHGDDPAWMWLTMELAEGGDLFDKIEADVGVKEDVAHLYFTQLCNAIAWCHGKGVAHRDIKPENMLLDGEGNLKLADFGLATQFLEIKTGQRKSCGMVCGSPPYIAPEILAVGNTNHKRKNGEDRVGYDPAITDIWSCAIVLFVLLVGNTPWDSPVAEESYEYYDYVKTKGKPADELWAKVPHSALSLVRGMLKVEPGERFSMQDVRQHPWYTQTNPRIDAKGRVADPIEHATTILESLHIDFNAEVSSSQRTSRPDKMEIDPQSADSLEAGWTKFASTQPETPAAERTYDWEAPPRLGAGMGVSASQPISDPVRTGTDVKVIDHDILLSQLAEDPTMSQFSTNPSVPLTLTQQARKFNDIVPAHSLARFLSVLTFAQLLPMLISALHRLNVPVVSPSLAAMEGKERIVSLRVKALDARKQLLQGNIVIEKLGMQSGAGGEVLEVRFLKAKGDPLGWRRLFKDVAVLCKDGIVMPDH